MAEAATSAREPRCTRRTTKVSRPCVGKHAEHLGKWSAFFDNGAMSKSPHRVLVVVNLGTPESPTAPAVRRYLAEFLGDRRVVNMPPAVWKPILHGIVLPFRGPKSAHMYSKVWTEQGSPLMVHTVALAEQIATLLPDWDVVSAMTYGSPALRSVLEQLHDDPPEQVVVLPLYPQYSTTTTASITDIIDAHGAGLNLHVISDYHDNDSWVQAVADEIARHRHDDKNHRHLLFSFHGLPQKVADAGDPYPQQCQAGAEAIAARLGLRDDQWSLSFQSRFGPAKWLQPATTDTVDQLAAAGVTELDVVCPGFAVDCLETLEEVSLRLAEQYKERGGTLRYLPCLNASVAHAEVLSNVVLAVARSTSPEADQTPAS